MKQANTSKWILQEQTDPKQKLYIHSITGSECRLNLIITDKDGRGWWGFQDLFNMPVMRQMLSKSISDLFTVGLTRADLKGWIARQKAILKPADGKIDPERYEKAYAQILNMENIIAATTEPATQYLTMASIYVVSDDENIEHFTHEKVAQKLELWKGDDDLAAFFLTWYCAHILDYIKDLKQLSQIASAVMEAKEAIQ
jgi:hypothetical protein